MSENCYVVQRSWVEMVNELWVQQMRSADADLETWGTANLLAVSALRKVRWWGTAADYPQM